MSADKAFTFAWRNAHRVPEPVLRGVHGDRGRGVGHAQGGVPQLERNLGRVRPGLDAKGLRRLSRAGMRSYMRYYREAFTLPAASAAQIEARVRLEGYENCLQFTSQGVTPVLALGHTGNWDLAGRTRRRTSPGC
ncbi:hypothetical protein NKG05_27375 [Oerskovia sp. M15]